MNKTTKAKVLADATRYANLYKASIENKLDAQARFYLKKYKMAVRVLGYDPLM